MKKWEYKIVPLLVRSYTKKGREKHLAELNELGNDGWELVGNLHNSGMTYFKREIKEKEQ
ncbi:MAG: DUF4177 domain-containing protein [Oscillospiraceae bacterium]|jgi:hypothetical protein|nr:DUF4177 domain-containing protein [Oscillospiraceae bacterium]